MAALALSSTGCGIIRPLRQRRGEAEHAGFLKDYWQLKPQEGYEANSLAGTKGLLRAFSKWADVENACNRWAERARDFLVKQGVQQKV